MFRLEFESILTEEEKEHQRKLNKDNGYGVNRSMLMRMTNKFEAAATATPQDTRTMAKIAFRLTAINFHHEVGMMMAGEFTELREELKTW